MTKVDYAEMAARLAPFLSGYIGPSTVVGSSYVEAPPQFGIRLVRGGTGYVEWFPASTEGFFDAVAASANGDAVLVPAGTYTFTEELYSHNNVAIIGENMQTTIIKTVDSHDVLTMWRGGLLKNFTFNLYWPGNGGSAPLYLTGYDEDTNTFINVPYVRNVTVNLEVASGAVGIDPFAYAMFWYWDQDYWWLELEGAKTITAVQDVYINVVDHRTPITYAANAFVLIFHGEGCHVIVDNVNVQTRNKSGHTNGIEIEGNGTSTREVRNTSIDIEVENNGDRDAQCYWLHYTNLYKCRMRIVANTSRDVSGVLIQGGYITIRDCDIYAEQTGSGNVYGIHNEYGDSLNVINSSVVAV